MLQYLLQHQKSMEADIIMDYRTSYDVFLIRCITCIISSRLNPFQQQQLQKHLNPLIDKIKMRDQQFEPVLLEVYLKTHSNRQILKIEEWSFSPTSILQQSIQSMESTTSKAKTKNKNVFGCRLSQKVYNQLARYKLDFNLTFQNQAVRPLEGDNVFQAPIEYFQFELFNSTLSLVYNYDFDSLEQEEEFFVLSPSTPPLKDTSFRKYSEGLQPMQPFTLKPQQISKEAIKQIKQKASKLKFQTMKSETVKQALNYLKIT